MALDELQDPQNLGSVLRTACFLGLGTGTAGTADTASGAPGDASVARGEGACGASGGIVVSARVHPGECNASWMMKGLIDYLVTDP